MTTGSGGVSRSRRIVKALAGALAFMVVWFVGCVVFDLWLGLQGVWMMSAGFATGCAAIVAQRFTEIFL